MKKIFLSFALGWMSFAALAQGGVLSTQDFEVSMGDFVTFNEGPTSSTFRRGTPESFLSEYLSVPNLLNSQYCAGFNDDAAGESDAGSDVYMMTPYADYSMYDSIRVYFDYHSPENYRGGYFVLGQTGDFNNMFDNGIFFNLNSTTNWTSIFATITPAMFDAGYGLNNVSIGFNYYDAEDWAYGLFIDNVTIIGYRQSPNENCATAIVLNPQASCTNTTATEGNMTGAAISAETSLCYPGENAPDVWFQFEAIDTTATVTASALVVYDLDILLEIYEGDCADYSLFHCQNTDDIDNGGTGMEVAELTGLTIGQTYYIRMFNMLGATDIGAFRICVESLPACTDPLVVTGGGAVCEGETLSTVTVEFPISSDWSFIISDGTTEEVLTVSGSNFEYTPSTPGTYTVTEASSVCQANQITGSAEVIQLERFEVHNPQTICANGSYTINGNTYSSEGSYTDVLTAANGCDSTVTTVLTVTTIAPIVEQNNEAFLVEPILDAHFEWINCDNDEVVATTENFVATENGEYRLRVTIDLCSEETECYVVRGLSIAKVESFDVAIYPNPTTSILTVSAKATLEQIQILDVNGRVIEAIDVNNTNHVINLQKYDAGIYLIQLVSNGQQVVKRVTKQ